MNDLNCFVQGNSGSIFNPSQRDLSSFLSPWLNQCPYFDDEFFVESVLLSKALVVEKHDLFYKKGA